MREAADYLYVLGYADKAPYTVLIQRRNLAKMVDYLRDSLLSIIGSVGWIDPAVRATINRKLRQMMFTLLFATVVEDQVALERFYGNDLRWEISASNFLEALQRCCVSDAN